MQQQKHVPDRNRRRAGRTAIQGFNPKDLYLTAEEQMCGRCFGKEILAEVIIANWPSGFAFRSPASDLWEFRLPVNVCYSAVLQHIT